MRSSRAPTRRYDEPVTKLSRRRLVFALIPTVVVVLLLETAARVWEGADRAARARAARIEEPSLARRGHETLVYVYGESTVVGVPVPEVGLVRQMEHYVARACPGAAVRFVNLGRIGVDSEGLRDLFESTISVRPDLAIVLCGHNEFLRAAPRERMIGGLLSHSAMVRAGARLAAKAWPGVRTREILPEHLAGVDRAGDLFRQKQRLYFENMSAVVRAARDAGVPLMLGTLPCNLRDWPPVFRRLDRPADDAADVAGMETALAAVNDGDVETLRSFVVGPAAARPDDPMFRFLRGRLRLFDGDAAGAMEDLVFARDQDPLPWRASSTFNDYVRTLARDERTLFVDVDAEFRADGVPGFDLLADNCHPSPEGARRMAQAILRAAATAGVLPPSASERCDLTEFLIDAGFTPGSPLRLRYVLENGKYMMKTPNFDYRIARRIFEKAALEFPTSWEVQGNLATALFFERRRLEGMNALQRGDELFGGKLDVSDRDALPYLFEALQRAGVSQK